MRKVELLWQLQGVDLALDKHLERLEALRAELADRVELDEATEARQTSRRHLRTLETEQKDLELQVDNQRDKLKQVEAKLYGGTVRNPKELDGLAKEVEQLRAVISGREDRVLGYIDQVEEATAELAAAQERFEAAEREWRERQQTLQAEQAQLEAEVARFEGERDRFRAALDPQALRLYDGLRRTRAGQAVVEIRQRTCQGCRISLPASEEIRARTSPDLVQCQSCGRILHA